MGCFDSTCAITRTAIHVGDEVLIVGIKPVGEAQSFNTYDLCEALAFHLDVKKQMVGQACRDDYTVSCSPLRFVAIGTYNDYGSIEGLEQEQGLNQEYNWWDWQILVHKEVVDSLLGRVVERTDDLLEVVLELVGKANRARIQLYTGLLGAQHYDEAELDLQKEICELTLEQLHKKFDRLAYYQAGS